MIITTASPDIRYSRYKTQDIRDSRTHNTLAVHSFVLQSTRHPGPHAPRHRMSGTPFCLNTGHPGPMLSAKSKHQGHRLHITTEALYYKPLSYRHQYTMYSELVLQTKQLYVLLNEGIRNCTNGPATFKIIAPRQGCSKQRTYTAQMFPKLRVLNYSSSMSEAPSILG